MNKREKDYWHSRMNAVLDDNVREKEVARIYSSQYRKIEKKILNLYDKAVSGSVQRSDLYKLKHYQDVISSIENQNKEIKKNLKAETLATLKGAYKGAFKEVSDMLDTSDKLTEQRDEMLSGVLKTKWSGDNWSRRIWKNTDYLSGRIKADVVTSIVSGASRDTLVKTLMDDYNAGFNDADRLIRTETAHCVNQAQLDIYKSDGIEYVEWSAGKDERMCKVCGRLHGKRFKVSEAPTIAHPRCRCTLIPVIPDNWTADKKPKPVDKSVKSGISGKYKHKSEENKVDVGYISSSEYKDKFFKLPYDEKVCKSIHKHSKAMLEHRKGTYYEDICLIDSRTGVVKVKSYNNKSENEVFYTKKAEKIVSENSNVLIAIHNHGTNNPPTGSDFVSAGYRKYAQGIVVCHDGTVYAYRVGKKPFTKNYFDLTVDKYKKRGYNEKKSIIKTLKDFAVDYGIEWSEL